jgi:glycosyltransferase involved in cell wall biosynthesis
VWQESTSLQQAGYRVSVICPRGVDDDSFEEIDGVRIHRYEPPTNEGGTAGYLKEFSVSWLRVARLALRIHRRDPFHVIQACNPPDTLWLLALGFRLRGVKFVYDQHDLCPEVFEVRFPEGKKPLGAGLRFLERMSYACATTVIAPNESYKAVAVSRGRFDPDRVHVVRSGPDPALMRRGAADPELRPEGRHLVCYLGIMGPQDGVDLVVRAVDVLVHDLGRTDIHVALLGFGDCLDELKLLAKELDVDQHVTFTGRADKQMISRYLSSAEVGLSPDPLNPFNDVSTMNKTLEYMAFELPVVSFDLRETRVSAGDAAAYVADGDIAGFARAVAEVIDDPERGAAMGAKGRERIERTLGWPHQRERYVAVYRALLGDAGKKTSAEVIDLRGEQPTVEVAR